MKFSAIAFALVATLVSAQSFESLLAVAPKCVKDCVPSIKEASGCAELQTSCLCTNAKARETAQTCIESKCGKLLGNTIGNQAKSQCGGKIKLKRGAKILQA